MTVTNRVLVSSRIVDVVQTTQYTALNVKAMLDKCTVTNVSGANATISINVVTGADIPGDSNLIIFSRVVASGETYDCPEVIGHLLENGGFVSTIANNPLALNIRITGREITS